MHPFRGICLSLLWVLVCQAKLTGRRVIPSKSQAKVPARIPICARGFIGNRSFLQLRFSFTDAGVDWLDRSNNPTQVTETEVSASGFPARRLDQLGFFLRDVAQLFRSSYSSTSRKIVR
jgi:hypothetical protein